MNPPEFPRVAGYHGEVVHNRDGSDLQIQWTNHASPLLKIMPDGSILFRALIIEWERKKNYPTRLQLVLFAPWRPHISPLHA